MYLDATAVRVTEVCEGQLDGKQAREKQKEKRFIYSHTQSFLMRATQDMSTATCFDACKNLI